MAVTSRSRRQDAPPAPADRTAELEAMVTTLARLVARLAVRSAPPSQASATFRQILVVELRIAQDREVEAIERWLTEHPG
jgi:hypothetical protein